MIELKKIIPATFEREEELLQLLRDAFAYMEGRIDPPSSLNRIDIASLRQKIIDEVTFVAVDDQQLIGCVFAKLYDDRVYLGKLAVRSDYRGMGLSRQLIARVEKLASECQLAKVELETRVELTENHKLFEHLGYQKVAENAHAGYSRPTSYCYRKAID